MKKNKSTKSRDTVPLNNSDIQEISATLQVCLQQTLYQLYKATLSVFSR